MKALSTLPVQGSLFGDEFILESGKSYGSSINMLGSLNVAGGTRQDKDFYATDPAALEALLEYEEFSHNVWECACGTGWLSKVMKDRGHNVRNSDIIKRADLPNFECKDFFEYTENDRDIITNPPYFCVNQFVRHAIDISKEGCKIAMILRLTFLEGQERKKLIFETDPPKKVYIFSKRILMAKDGEYPKGSAVAYAWFVWEKGFKGNPEILWL